MRKRVTVNREKREGVTAAQMVELFGKLPPESVVMLDDWPVSKAKATVRGVTITLDLYGSPGQS